MASTDVLVPAPQTRAEFLASSHFKIAQNNDPRQTNTKSVFKKDYVPWNDWTRQGASVPPKPSEVLHKDARYFNERQSETVNAFVYQPTQNTILRDAPSKLGRTNFKMDADVTKFDSFQTSHSLDYTPKANGRPITLKKQDYRNVIPQGDPEKTEVPMSDYRDRFKGHDTSQIKIFKAPSKHHGGPPTIVGDQRQHHFDTTNLDTYQGIMFPRVNTLPAPTGTNIPEGDKEKMRVSRTIQQSSYPEHDSALLKGYNKDGVTAKLQQSNFKQKDGHGEWDTYMSTFKESYQPSSAEYVKYKPPHGRNHSDMPPGDDDDYRNSERLNSTTNRFHFGKSPNMPKPEIIYGANRRTRSNVWFGDPDLGDRYYDTTMEEQYQPQKMPDKLTAQHNNTKSCVPVNYYPGMNEIPTALASYQDPHQLRMDINPEALNRLKRSHIGAPLGGERQFSTEHLDQYIPKYSNKISVDSGKLQRSTVPLGTLKI